MDVTVIEVGPTLLSANELGDDSAWRSRSQRVRRYGLNLYDSGPETWTHLQTGNQTKTGIQDVVHTCSDVIEKCNVQCNNNHQCEIACVSCPDNPRDKCWVLPDQCQIHSDG